MLSLLAKTVALALYAASLGSNAAPAPASDSLASIKHIVLFMQENRAFDHYFGTMAGVRGFKDPNVVISNNTHMDAFHQPVDATKMAVGEGPPPGVTVLRPWYWNHEGGDANDRYQCSLAGSNGWQQNHAAWDKGNIDQWAIANTPYSLGHYKRADIPFHFAVAEGWTVSDSYHESVIASTDPNRISWVSGTIGVDQSKERQGGPFVDNNESDGCETSPDGSKYSCYPYEWVTVPELLENAGISWQVYQDTDNFDDNPLAWSGNFQKAANTSALATKGLSFVGLDKFYSDAKAGTLPQVSYIIGPTDLSEHPPYGPLDGAWLQNQVVQAVTTGANYQETALIISYDETGGWADHVMAPLAPPGTDAEYLNDPFTPSLGSQPTGPGFRLPFYIISPWTRNGGVFTETSSHESQILFLEKWAAAVGKAFTNPNLSSWRRSHMSDLVNMFDFSSRDVSVPALPATRTPSQDPSTGQYNGAAVCQAKYGGTEPTVPYLNQSDATNLAIETGFKPIRGTPTEGRFLTFEASGVALSYNSKSLTLSPSTATHCQASQRFILHAASPIPNQNQFKIQTATLTPPLYIAPDLSLTSDSSKAGLFALTDLGNGQGYTVMEAGGKNSLQFDNSKTQASLAGSQGTKLSIFSVSC